MVWYCTRESVKAALDEAETARSNDQVDAAIAAGAVDVNTLCSLPPYATLAPTLATYYFDWPSRRNRQPSWRLRFDGRLLLSATSVAVDNGATVLDPSTYNLEPANWGPPYRYLETKLNGAGALSAGGTHQRAVVIAGLWGAGNDRVQVGTLSSGLAASTSATASLAWTTARIGVGTVLFIDDEAMIISERNFTSSGQVLGGSGLAAASSAVQVAVTDGTGFAVEEIISIGGERMRVVDIIGNTLTVKRAWDGSQLAAHSNGDSISALTGVELTRAQLGATLAAHSSSAAVYAWRPPDMLATLNRAYALNTLLQERSGYARVAGTGENAREFTGRGIAALEADVRQAYGPGVRTRAVV